MAPLPLRETERGLGFLGCGQYRIADGRQAGARSCVSGMTAVAALAGNTLVSLEPSPQLPCPMSVTGETGRELVITVSTATQVEEKERSCLNEIKKNLIFFYVIVNNLVSK